MFTYAIEITIDHCFYGVAGGKDDGLHGSNSLRRWEKDYSHLESNKNS